MASVFTVKSKTAEQLARTQHNVDAAPTVALAKVKIWTQRSSRAWWHPQKSEKARVPSLALTGSTAAIHLKIIMQSIIN